MKGKATLSVVALVSSLVAVEYVKPRSAAPAPQTIVDVQPERPSPRAKAKPRPKPKAKRRPPVGGMAGRPAPRGTPSQYDSEFCRDARAKAASMSKAAREALAASLPQSVIDRYKPCFVRR